MVEELRKRLFARLAFPDPINRFGEGIRAHRLLLPLPYTSMAIPTSGTTTFVDEPFIPSTNFSAPLSIIGNDA